MSRLFPVASALLLLTACPSEEGKEGGTAGEPGAAASASEEPAKACRAQDAHELAVELSKASIPTKQARVGEGLPSVCDLTDAQAAFLAATEPGAASDARFAAAVKHIDLLDEVCPKDVTEALGAMKPGARAAAMFDKCGLGAHALAERDDWLAHGPSSVVPFMTKGWLVQQGVAPEDALTLSQALVLRDRTRWAASDQSLPKVEGALGAVPTRSVAVQVTPNEVRVAGTRVLTLEDGRVPAPPKGEDVHPDVVKLREAMLAERETFPEDATVALAVVADASVHARTLDQVAAQASEAKLGSMLLVGMSGVTGEGALPFVTTGSPVGVVDVFVDSKGFRVSSPGSEPKTFPKPYDFDALQSEVLEHVKNSKIKVTGVRLHPEDDIPVSVLASLFARLGPPRCSDGDAAGCVELTVQFFAGLDPLAAQSGILAIMAAESGSFLGSPHGVFESEGFDEDVWGGLTGTEVGEAFGAGGLGLVGTGRGGGGTGEGTIGLGNAGLIGGGEGGGSGSGYGTGGSLKGGRKVAKVRQGKHTVTGSLDKQIIRRIVRAHVNEVRYCYEKGLVGDPSLEGTVTIDFTISGNGKVTASSVASDSVGDGTVGTCVSKKIKRWRFPKPLGGGVVKVKYPFTFSPG
ncbi:MAG: AgmX/PglI C-terminal domain-containing protein [Myxococcota bacterium]